jgi:hypothetical protein
MLLLRMKKGHPNSYRRMVTKRDLLEFFGGELADQEAATAFLELGVANLQIGLIFE